MPNTQNLATVGVTNRQDTDNIIVEQGGNIRRVQYGDIKTGILKGDAADGTISTFEESAEEFPIPAPATPQKTLWGRVKKFCSDFNDWKTGVMLFGHLVNNAESDSDTLPLAASVAKLLQEQITTNTSALAQLNRESLKRVLKTFNDVEITIDSNPPYKILSTFSDAGVPEGHEVVALNVFGWEAGTGLFTVAKNSNGDSIVIIAPKGTFHKITIEIWYK